MSHLIWARPVRAVVRSKSEGDIASTLYGSIWIGIWNDLEWDKKISLISTMASFGQISVFPHVFYRSNDRCKTDRKRHRKHHRDRHSNVLHGDMQSEGPSPRNVWWVGRSAVFLWLCPLSAAVATALVRKTDCAARWKLGVFGCAVGWNLISRSPLEM